ncbi:MAG TPA: hypothetical protein VLZ03_02985 [Thermodesulfobacteriota bacterium]|nr:hypothetical protein [Thermodesulfobacteriota bacterium]
MAKSAEARRFDRSDDCQQTDVLRHSQDRRFLRGRTKSTALLLLLILFLFLQTSTAISVDPSGLQDYLIRNIPARPFFAMKGSEFAKMIFSMNGSMREQAILAQLMEGNLPDFLRRLIPVRLSHRLKDGRRVTISIFVMPDYLAIGSDSDFLLMPMALQTATQIAFQFGFILPTKKMVDAIFRQSGIHLAPEPLPAGPEMTSTAYYVKHDERIKEQRETMGRSLSALVSGHKKDVVLSKRLAQAAGRIAIYGWHRLSGIPIQPLTTVHPASYADYSHGIRLVSETVLVEGKPESIYSVLQDPELTNVLSDEGPIQVQRLLLSSHASHSYR